MSEPLRSRRLLRALAAFLGVVLCWSLVVPERGLAARAELAASRPAPAPRGDLGPGDLGPSEVSESCDPEVQDACFHGYVLLASADPVADAASSIAVLHDETADLRGGHDLLARERGPPLG